jgi:enoyl-CoA hydratase
MLEEMPFPVIAAVCGPAFGGGCEMVLSCDFRVFGESAELALPEVGLGILPGAGGTQRLVRLIGLARAKEVVLLGRRIKATEALSLGLATAVVPDTEVMHEAVSLAQKLVQKPAIALMLAKQAMQGGEEYGMAAGKAMENLLFGLAFASTDQQEGLTAFVERRKPTYTHQRKG